MPTLRVSISKKIDKYSFWHVQFLWLLYGSSSPCCRYKLPHFSVIATSFLEPNISNIGKRNKVCFNKRSLLASNASVCCFCSCCWCLLSCEARTPQQRFISLIARRPGSPWRCYSCAAHLRGRKPRSAVLSSACVWRLYDIEHNATRLDNSCAKTPFIRECGWMDAEIVALRGPSMSHN